jgi:hypothetical protein
MTTDRRPAPRTRQPSPPPTGCSGNTPSPRAVVSDTPRGIQRAEEDLTWQR